MQRSTIRAISVRIAKAARPGSAGERSARGPVMITEWTALSAARRTRRSPDGSRRSPARWAWGLGAERGARSLRRRPLRGVRPLAAAALPVLPAAGLAVRRGLRRRGDHCPQRAAPHADRARLLRRHPACRRPLPRRAGRARRGPARGHRASARLRPPPVAQALGSAVFGCAFPLIQSPWPSCLRTCPPGSPRPGPGMPGSRRATTRCHAHHTPHAPDAELCRDQRTSVAHLTEVHFAFRRVGKRVARRAFTR